jgi:hypothetical protein
VGATLMPLISGDKSFLVIDQLKMAFFGAGNENIMVMQKYSLTSNLTKITNKPAGVTHVKLGMETEHTPNWTI